MFLIMELLFVVLLIMILFMLYKNEYILKKSLLARAKIREYWNGSERRKHFRFKKDLEVNYIIEKKPHLKNKAKTVDISEGGMKLLMDKKIDKGSILDLYITIPDSKKVAEVEGKVAWTEDAGEKDALGKRFFYSGVSFLAMREPSANSLLNYIRSIASEVKS